MTKVADALVTMSNKDMDKDKDKDKTKIIPTRPSSPEISFTDEWPVVGGVHGQAVVSEVEASARVAAAVAEEKARAADRIREIESNSLQAQLA